MAVVNITLTDNVELGTVDVRMEFDPIIEKDARTTEAQSLALALASMLAEGADDDAVRINGSPRQIVI